MTISSHEKLLSALEELAQLDPDMRFVLTHFGPPPDRFHDGGFKALARTIVGQQISRAVADKIWQKMTDASWVEDTQLAKLDYEKLQEIGLSRRKAEYIIDLARAVDIGQLNLAELKKKPAEEFYQILCNYRGIGHWSASNYRLFCLADLDAWPGNDLALMEALRLLKKLESRPTHDEMNKAAEQWKPWRGAAALLLWHLYACEVRNARPMG